MTEQLDCYLGSVKLRLGGIDICIIQSSPYYKMEGGVSPKSSIVMPQLKNNVNCIRGDLRIICILIVI